MAKHLNVNLQFTADTSQAASQIKNLQTLLANLTNGSAIGKDLPITRELIQAQQAAGRLKAVLNDSLNPKGTLDIGKFTQNFNKAGLDLNKIKGQLEGLGPAGSKAFAQMAQSIATADAPLRRTNKTLTELGTTLKNTVRWQLTSSMVHGFVGGIQEAFTYVKQLDRSLTDIRIVSGLSADEMARFAEQANKSAQALSTTTTKYTDAALIYYQQGLDDQTVKERTDVTVKMANVTGEQVKDVSSYMTAIWNNFNKDGQNAVEHYADIMTELGAATAASTDEIAAGLSKFSAVADTIGLSFDMASSSVTAIVDQTRETPEVVGTALKTIFSRVEGLKQGETLEDGVDLNKYSTGLKTVGVDIMDTNGQLKDMDQILHEIGDVWETLDKNQQVALAQTVAGIRQYNQFMALFDNWGKVEENLDLAANAGGTLQEQADIYAESWKAAQDRVRAAAQAIYSDLLNDDFFKGLLDGIAFALKGIDQLIDSMGGLSGVIGALGVVFTRIFEKQMLAGISNVAYNIRQLTKAGRAENKAMREQAFDAWRNTGAMPDTKEGKFQTDAINAQATLQQKLYAVAKGLDEETLKRLQHEISINQQLQEQTVALGKQADLLDGQMAKSGTKTVREAIDKRDKTKHSEEDIRKTYSLAATASNENIQGIYSGLTEITNKHNNSYFKDETNKKRKVEMLKSFRGEQEAAGNTQVVKELDGLIKKANSAKVTTADLNKEIMKLIQSENLLAAASDDSVKNFDKLAEQTNIETKTIREQTDAQANAARSHAMANHASQQTKKATSDLVAQISNAKAAFSRYSTAIVSGAQAASSLTMGISSLVSVFQVLNNEDMSFGEKFLSIAMSLSMAIPMIASGFSGLSETIKNYRASKEAATAADQKSLAASIKNIATTQLEVIAEKVHTLAKKGETAATAENTVAENQNTIAKNKGAAASLKAAVASRIAGIAAKGAVGGFIFLVAAIAAVVAIGAGLVALYKHIKENSPEAQLENARNKANELGQAFDNASNYADNLRSAIDNFNNMGDALDGCIKGTEEYRKALMDSNQAALELLKLYPQLRAIEGAVGIDSDGRIRIGEQALEDAQKEADQSKVAAQLASTQANQEVYRLEASHELGNLAQDAIGDLNFGKGQNASQYGIKGEDFVTSAIKENADVIATWGKSPEKLAQEIFGTTQEKYVEVAENLIENQDEFFNYANEAIQQGVDAIATQGLVGDYIRADDELAGYANDSDLIAASARQYESRYEEEYEKQQDRDLTQGNVEKYLKAQGITDYSDVEVDGDEATYKVGDEEITIQKDTIDSFIASGKALKHITKGLDELDAVLNQLAASGKGADKALKGILTSGTTDEASFNQNEQLFTEIGLKEDNTEAENKELIGKHLEEKGITEENTENYDEIVQAIIDGFSQVDQQKTDVKNDLQNTTKEIGLKNNGFTNEAIEKMGVSTASEVNAATKQIYEEEGKARAKAYIESINEASSQSEIEDITEKRVGNAAQFSSDIESFDLDKSEVEAYKKELIETNEACEENASLAEEIAVAHKRMQKGVQKLADNWDNWNETMSSDEPEEYTKNIGEIKEAVGDLLDLSEENMEALDPKFIHDNWDLIKDTMNGVEGAYEDLLAATAKKIAIDLDLEPDVQNKLNAQIDNIANAIDDKDITFGASLDTTGYTAALNEMILSGNMTVSEVSKVLEGLQFSPEITYEEVPVASAKKYAKNDEIEIFNPETGEIEKISLNSVADHAENGMIKVPIINGATTKYTGNPKAASPTTRGGGGGGGGSRAPERRTASKKKASNEKERYYTVTNQLEDMEHQLDKITTAKDRAFGINKIKEIDKETEALNNLLGKQREYQNEIQSYLQKDKNKLVNMNIGVKFDENGTITNYDKLMEDAVNKYNQRISSYNAKSGSGQESLDNKYKNKINAETGEVYGSYEGWAQAEFDRVKNAIDQYTETQDLAKEVETSIQDTLNQIYDLKLERVEYIVELKVDAAEDDLELLDFLLERVDDNAFQAAEKILYLGESVEASLDKINAYKVGLQDLFDAHGLDGSALVGMLENGDLDGVLSALEGKNFTEAEIEFIRDAKAEMLDNLSEIRDVQIEIIELVADVFDSHMEEFDKIIEQTEHLQDVTSAYGEIIEVVGRKAAGVSYETMKMLNETATDLAIDKVSRAKTKYDEATREYQDALEQRNRALAAGDEELISHWDETCENIREGMQDAQSEFMDSWVEALEQARTEFDNTIQMIIEDFKSAMGGLTGGLDALSNQFDLQSKAAENYLPEYERIYELNKLIRDIDNSVDETSNVKAKQALLELEEEVNKAREDGKELSEYDLNYLRKRYELKVAELALKEAKDAKSQVRMTKDSEGNFSYVYTADDAAVETAEQNYEDKLFEMQQMNAEYINTLQQSLIDLNNEYASQFEQLGELYEIGSVEYVAALDQLQNWYANQQLYYTSQLDGVMNNNAVLYEVEVTRYAEMTNNKAMLDMEYISQFSQLPLAILSGYTEMEQYQNAWKEISALMYEEAAISAENYRDRQNEAMQAAGTAMEEFSETMQSEVEKIGDQNEQLTTDMNETLTEVQENWDAVIDKVALFAEQYEKTVTKLISLNEKLTKTMNDLLKEWSGVKEAEIKQNAPRGNGSSGGGSGGSGGSGGGGGGGKPAWSRVVAAYDKINQGKWGNGLSTRIRRGAADGFSEAEVRAGQQLIDYTYPTRLRGKGYSREKAKQLMGYDTGGYTGKWGNKEGKLALLHQKELVLNPGDTENFLKTVNIVRDISQMIDLNALSAGGAFKSSLHSTGIRDSNAQTVQQDVHITAEFPNATNKEEILSAFDNVINLAAQYANRK